MTTSEKVMRVSLAAVVLGAIMLLVANDRLVRAQPTTTTQTTEVVVPAPCEAFIRRADRWAWFTSNLLVTSTDTLDAAIDQDSEDLTDAAKEFKTLASDFDTLVVKYADTRTRCLEAMP